MIRNNLLIAFRQLSKNRIYAVLNILGLAIGIAASLLIYRILRYELSFNQNFEKSDRIVRVLTKITGGEKGEVRERGLPIPAMAAMETTISQFAKTSRVREDWPTVSIPGTAGDAPLKKIHLKEEEISYFVDPAFLQIFNFQWIVGDPSTALNEAGDIVLTERVAKYCFEKAENALGKTVVLDNNVPCIVRGVIKDLPPNCDFPIFTLASFATLRAHADLYFFKEDEWGSISSNNQFFALLHDKNQFAIATTAVSSLGRDEMNRNRVSRNVKASLDLQTLADMHYDDEVGSAGTHTISRTRLWVLGSIGFLVLLMACFNFINLATALATMRAREVGVRKAIGGARGALVAQFMTETSLIVTLSICAGAALAAICSPLLKRISEVPDSQPFLTDPAIWLFLAAVGIVVTLLSGLYPSVVLSGFSPIKALKNDASRERGGGISLRKGLVIAQFTIAQALIIGAIVTVSQLDYIRDMDMGFNKDLILTTGFNADSAALTKLESMKQRLQQIPSVEQVSFSSDQPASGNTWSSNFAFGRKSEDAVFHTSIKMCDADYAKTYGIQLLAGRWFAPSDTVKEYVINETMCRKLGIAAESAVGKDLKVGGGKWLPIAGVVKDFHTHSAHQEHQALTMLPRKKFYSSIGIKIQPKNIAATTEAVRKVYDETFPEQVFESKFFDESIAEFYRSESRFSDFCKGIAGLAILIGCLGLFGLATHAAARRTKEIGVRKVLGASAVNITGLLTRDFLKLVLVAIFIATPIAYYLMQKWLSDFVFRIDLQWWMFAAACTGALAVAFFTVSFQSLKAALANPVKSLRSE